MLKMLFLWIKIQNKLWKIRKNILIAKSAIKTQKTEEMRGAKQRMLNFNILGQQQVRSQQQLMTREEDNSHNRP